MLVECKESREPVENLVKNLTDAELVQVYKNIKRNASAFGAIAEIHGVPSGLYDYATRIANELPAKMRERGIRADPIEAKPFDPMDEKNEELVRPFVRAFLLPLAGEHVDVQSVLDRLLEYQQSRDDRWMQSLPLLSKGEISRICDNLDRNGGFLSAISQTHGNPSALHDFATGFVGLLLVEATKHEMTKSIEPKPFDLTTRRTSQ